MTENEISRIIYEAAIEVHKTLGGPGLLENIYEEALAYELTLRGLNVSRQVQVPVIYKNFKLTESLVIDILVEDKVIIECKATNQYNQIFEIQTMTYLRLTGLKLGMIINFGEPLVKNGIHRVVNNL
ncbi:MAG TPA: GxxExxY protein [Candidatus Cloacimonadota bacterium]|nr:GxxExxY protein [Candidatus Cloacimonadota bacterium]